MKKCWFLSILLALALLCLLLATPAQTAGSIWRGGADQPPGAGTSQSPYQIGTAEELAWFAGAVNSGEADICAELTGNIVLNNTGNWQSWAVNPPDNEWIPIGNSTCRFAGVFNGKGFTISGIYIGGGGTKGLFGYTGGGTIKNVNVTALYINGTSYLGGICGANGGGTIENVRATASYISGSSFLGGICGANEDGTITGACYAGTVAGASTGAGGICGHNVRATVSNSYNSGTVSGVNSAGGVCGLTNSGAVIGCGNEGEIITNGSIGTAAAGGVCGAITSSAVSEQPSIIRDSYNAGTVRGSAKTGGVTGSIDSGGNRIEHCHNWGMVSGPADRTGSVCGWNSGEIMDCYYRAGSNAKGIGYGSGAVTEKTSAQFASGELAHLMGEPFGQTIGSWNYPVHRAADGSNVVYKLTYMSGETVHAAQYYNRDNVISGVTDPTAPEGLFFLGWVDLPGIMPAKDLVITAHFGPAEPPLITTESLPGVKVGEAYSTRIEAEGTEPITFSVAAGSLPPGLSLGEGSGAITGTPTAYGVFTFTIRAAGPDGSHDERELSITVTAAPIITTSALPFGRPGEPYSCRITATGTTPITFEATGLPPGLAISAGGLISGVPEETGVYQVTITADNNIPPRAEVTLDLIIKTAVWDGTMKQPASGNGTESNPYEIAAAEELAWFANRVNSGSRKIHAILIADITLNDTGDWQDWANQPPENKWTPIGSGPTSTFMGTFKGNNHTVSGIYIDSPVSYRGLFGALGSGGRIENVGVAESYIRGLEYVGGVCGASYSGWIIDCSNAGIVSSFNPSPQIHYANAGGVCGNNTGGTIRGSYNTGLVDGSGHAVGGVCGANSGTVDTCYNAGTVSGSGSMYGGICGNNSATGVMIDVYNTGAAGSTGGNIGGICGHNMGAVTNAHSSGAGTGAFTFGGVCGTNGGNVENCYYTQADGIGYSLPQGTVAEVVRKTPVQFASGEVAYLLGAAFGQTLGAVPEPAPVFRAADPDNAVYRLTYLNGTVVCAAQYYNYGDTVTDPVTTGEIPPPASESGDFAGWAGLPPTMPACDLEVAALFIQIPDAPGNLTATPGDGQVELTWSAPADDGGSDISGYNIYRDGTKLNENPLAALTYLDTSLANGTTYEYTVAAVNAAGEGAGAAISAVPRTVPGAPVGLAATPGDEQVELTWSAPADDGGSAVLGYDVYRDGTKLNEDPLAALTYVDTGLANGTSYEYTVKAVNAAGEGTGATVSAVPRTVPGAPAGLAATPGNGQVKLTWSEPADDGGSAVLGYNIYRGEDKVNAGLITGLSYTDSSLTNGVSYSYTVKAANVAGEGTGATVSAVPRTVPGTPGNLTATPGNGQVELTWSEPADDGGSAVLGYNVYRDGTKLNEDPLAALTYVDTGLANGTSYEYTVKAVNTAGEGTGTAISTVPRTVPGAPGNLTATPGDEQVELTWSAPADDGGSAVLGYNIYRNNVKVNAGLITGLSYTDSSLANGVSYSYTVKAVNAAGEGTGATVSAVPRTVPGTPGNLTATPGNGQVELTWSEPADDGGSAVLGYNVYRDEDKVNAGLITGLSYTDSSLTNGVSYSYTVKAVNAAGEGTGATASAVPRTVPGAPGNLTATPGDEQVELTWSAPADDGGSAVLGYNVYRDGTKLNENPLAVLTYLDTGLANGTTYEYTVASVNVAGEGERAKLETTPTYSYEQRSLTDSGSGISVSGIIRRDSVLEVGDLKLHDKDECAACDEIRKYQNDDDYVFILAKEINLSHGFTGTLTITIEVGSRYNGQEVTILHCAGGVLKTYSATASGGKVTFTVTELSPFALFVGAPPAPMPLPKTIFGGPALLWWALSAAAAGLAVFFLLYRRRRLQK